VSPGVAALLAPVAYPGRVVVIGTDPDGRGIWLYAVTGRSPSSLDRHAVIEPGRVRIGARAMEGDDPLRHYVAVVEHDGNTFVGNGDHVSVVADRCGAGDAIETAIADVEPEPDPPILTPRLVAFGRCTGAAWTGYDVVGVQARGGRRVERVVHHVGAPVAGRGSMIKTYVGDDRSPMADARPVDVEIDRPVADLVDAVWQALDPRYRVLVVGGGPRTMRTGEGCAMRCR